MTLLFIPHTLPRLLLFLNEGFREFQIRTMLILTEVLKVPTFGNSPALKHLNLSPYPCIRFVFAVQIINHRDRNVGTSCQQTSCTAYRKSLLYRHINSLHYCQFLPNFRLKAHNDFTMNKRTSQNASNPNHQVTEDSVPNTKLHRRLIENLQQSTMGDTDNSRSDLQKLASIPEVRIGTPSQGMPTNDHRPSQLR